MTAAWTDLAACVGLDVDMFFPERWEQGQGIDAMHVCFGCPVRAQCFVVNIYERDGVWGGSSAKQRRQFRGQHRPLIEAARAACGLTPDSASTRGVMQQMLRDAA